jgi:co-chaperonin GroES (HSP10)
MPTIMPFGSRIFVDDIIPVADLVARGKAVGLTIVTLEENEPKPTEGIVIAVGTDPLLQEYVKVGDHVTFARHAGVEQRVEGHSYRCLEMREIIAVIKPTEPLCQPGSEDPDHPRELLVDRPSSLTEP